MTTLAMKERTTARSQALYEEALELMPGGDAALH
jgi:hypothetical protein